MRRHRSVLSLSLNASKVKQDCLRSLNTLTPSAPVLVQLISTLNQEDCSFSEVSAIIEKDAVLAGNILKTVNSPLFSTVSRITSIRHSLAILGVSRVRNLALGLSVIRFFSTGSRPRSWSQSSFNYHCVATGVMAQLLAEEQKLEPVEDAFVAGLLHAVGRLLFTITYPDLAQEIAAARQSYRHLSNLEFEEEFLGIALDELSGTVLERWRLPEHVIAAVRLRSAECDSEPAGLPCILDRAHRMANAQGVLSTVCAMTLLVDDSALECQRLKETCGNAAEKFDERFQLMKAQLSA